MAILPLKKTKTRLVILILFVLAAIGVFIGLSMFIRSDIDKAQEIENELYLKNQQRSRLNSITALVQDSEADRNRLASYTIGEDGVVDFVSELESLASTTNVTLDITSLGIIELPNAQEDLKNKFEALQTQLQIRGNWNSVIHFVALIEHLPQHHYISSVSFNNKGGEEWDATLTIRAFKQKEQ